MVVGVGVGGTWVGVGVWVGVGMGVGVEKELEAGGQLGPGRLIRLSRAASIGHEAVQAGNKS